MSKLTKMKGKQFMTHFSFGQYTIHFKRPGEKYAHDLYRLSSNDKDKIASLLEDAGYTKIVED